MNQLTTDMRFAIPTSVADHLSPIKRKTPETVKGMSKVKRFFSMEINHFYTAAQNDESLLEKFEFCNAVVSFLDNTPMISFLELHVFAGASSQFYPKSSVKGQFFNNIRHYLYQGNWKIDIELWHRMISTEVYGNRDMRMYTDQQLSDQWYKDYVMDDDEARNNMATWSKSYREEFIGAWLINKDGMKNLLKVLFIMFGRYDTYSSGDILLPVKPSGVTYGAQT